MTATSVTSLGLRNVLKRVLASPHQVLERSYRPVQLTTVDGRLLNLKVVQFNSTMVQVLLSVPNDPHFARALAEMMLSELSSTLTWISLGIISKNLCWAGTDADAVPDLTKLLQTVLQSQMCACQQHIIVDNQNCCFTCHLSLTPEGLAKHTCPVCLDTCVAPVQQMQCCGKWIHVACLKKHLNMSQNKSCPLCRGGVPHHDDEDQRPATDITWSMQYLATLPDIGQILHHL